MCYECMRVRVKKISPGKHSLLEARMSRLGSAVGFFMLGVRRHGWLSFLALLMTLFFRKQVSKNKENR